MAGSPSYQRAQVILEAVRLATDADVPRLNQLTTQQPQTLKLELILRIILTFLPESTDPALYVNLLRHLSANPSIGHKDAALQTLNISEQGSSEDDAAHRVQKLHLLPLADPRSFLDRSTDTFTTFLLHRAHKIDSETGSLPLVAQLLGPFVDHSEYLRTWMVSTLCPLLRLDYEYYPHRAPAYSLDDFERLDGSPAIHSLLSEAARIRTGNEQSEIGRDLRGLVGPWMYGENGRKRRKLDNRQRRSSSVLAPLYGPMSEPSESDTTDHTTGGWAHVNEWLLKLAVRDFPRAVKAIVQWDGPGDVDYGDWGDGFQQEPERLPQSWRERYMQAGLATLYATSSSTVETLEGSRNILVRVAQLMDLPSPPPLQDADTIMNTNISQGYCGNLSQAHLLYDSLLGAQNPLTSPSRSSISLAYLLLASAYTLETFGHPKTCKSVAELSVSGTESDQIAELRKALFKVHAKTRDEKAWDTIRHQVLWLRDWNWQPNAKDSKDSEDPRGAFCKIRRVDMEIEILKAILSASCYKLAVDTYCTQRPAPLPVEMLEKTVLNSAMSSYDAASNGNRTRGGVRKASEIITTFRDYFPQSKSFNQIQSLLLATHALSFYSLTLQQGVPLQPVNIRAHQDPLSLIGKVLDQNPRSYTKLDDLVRIGENLVAAGLGQSSGTTSSTEPDPNQESLAAKRRITGMAIEAALTEEDFDTAYSYVINRLSPSNVPNPNNLTSSSTSANGGDDISWRAAYQAGRHQSSKSAGLSSLRRLEQRMELLSQALLLAPTSVLSEILSVWRRCEEEMSLLIAREVEEEKSWDDKGDRRLPGDFSRDNSPIIQKPRDPSRAAANEEAPMGLFDVARGAAAALSKSAFPLRSARTGGSASGHRTSPQRPRSAMSAGGSDSESLSAKDGEGRVRKRDMVSSMVTGGLASGLGWVLGKLMIPLPRSFFDTSQVPHLYETSEPTLQN